MQEFDRCQCQANLGEEAKSRDKPLAGAVVTNFVTGGLSKVLNWKRLGPNELKSIASITF